MLDQQSMDALVISDLSYLDEQETADAWFGTIFSMDPSQVERLHNAVSELVHVLRSRLDDHDLLVEMRTNQANLLGEVRSMRTDNAVTEADHERRIRAVEAKVMYGMGAIAVLVVVLKFIHFV